MKTIDSIAQLSQIRDSLNTSIGFVPTMGALHDGHISLIKKSIHENSVTIVSIYINPTQFSASEDLEKYPKSIDKDTLICQNIGVDYLFLPTSNQIYKNDEILIKAPSINGYILEGYKRPEHFNGMLQIVLKLLNITRATNVYFGKKDAQQLILIKQMVKNLFLNINIIECEIVREDDGLAMSSRNIYLSKDERKEAAKISKSLFDTQKLINSGELNILILENYIKTQLSHLDIEYIKILKQDLTPIQYIEKNNSIILLALKIGSTRLIDNIWI